MLQQRRVVFDSHYKCRKRYVFSFVLNVASDMFSRKSGGRLFHTAGPLYAKLRCPVDVWTWGVECSELMRTASFFFICLVSELWSAFNLYIDKRLIYMNYRFSRTNLCKLTCLTKVKYINEWLRVLANWVETMTKMKWLIKNTLNGAEAANNAECWPISSDSGKKLFIYQAVQYGTRR